LLIAARAVQGFGGAAVLPLSLTILTTVFPAERRGMIVGIYGGLAGLAVAAGPLVGGAVTQGLDWHWIFWINVPLGVAATPLSLRLLPIPAQRVPQLGLADVKSGAVDPSEDLPLQIHGHRLLLGGHRDRGHRSASLSSRNSANDLRALAPHSGQLLSCLGVWTRSCPQATHTSSV
jgi:MFS family permease